MEDQKKLSETTKHENSLWISQELFSFPLFPSPNPPLPFPSPPLPLPSSPLPSPLLFLFLLFLFFSFLYTQLKPEVYFSYSMLLFSGTFIFFLFINNPLTANKHSQKKPHTLFHRCSTDQFCMQPPLFFHFCGILTGALVVNSRVLCGFCNLKRRRKNMKIWLRD